MADHETLIKALLRLHDIDRERLQNITITASDTPTATFHLAGGCGQPITRPLNLETPIADQVSELTSTKLLGTIAEARTEDGWSLQPWSTKSESRAWMQRTSLSLLDPRHSELLAAAGAIKAQQIRLQQTRDDLTRAIWHADGAVRGVTRSDLMGLAQTSRATFYAAIDAKPDDLTYTLEELPFTELEADEPTPTPDPPRPPSEPAPVVAPTPTPAPTRTPEPASSAPTALPVTPRTPTSRPTKGDRFTAPATVLDGTLAYFADGSSAEWSARHLGDLAEIASAHRLGWGGGEDRLPDLGQIWLGPDALTTLGLPTDLGVTADEFDQEKRAKQLRQAFEAIAGMPAITMAEQDGWEFSTIRAWIRMWHPDHCRAGVMLVVPPWQGIGQVALLAPGPDDRPENGLADGLAPASVLAFRLRAFAQATGVAYRLSPAATGLDLIDHTRPPRRDSNDDRGQSRNRAALIRGKAAELPGFLQATDDNRFANIEADFSWWRPWESLSEAERARKYAVAFDRGRSYLAPWSSISLGMEGLVHTEDAVWSGKEDPGYWLIDEIPAGEWPWSLPSVPKAAGAHVEDGRMWVTTHTLRQLAMAGITPQVHESYTWQTNSRYLEGASKQLRQALDTATDPAVVATVKNLYTSTVGKLGQREHRSHYHLWRPDWRHHIIAATRTAILRTVQTAQELSGAVPLVVDRDTIIYAVDTDQVVDAWPGDPSKLGRGIGAWKPASIAPLAQWGPKHLPGTNLTWRYRYTDAMDAMTLWGADH